MNRAKRKEIEGAIAKMREASATLQTAYQGENDPDLVEDLERAEGLLDQAIESAELGVRR